VFYLSAYRSAVAGRTCLPARLYVSLSAEYRGKKLLAIFFYKSFEGWMAYVWQQDCGGDPDQDVDTGIIFK